MIRDEHLKRFLLFQFNKNINQDIKTISTETYKTLTQKFIKKEKVMFLKESLYGNIHSRSKNRYTIRLDNGAIVVNVKHEDLRRLDFITVESIFNFLLYITTETPFTVRLLKQNILEEIFKSTEPFRPVDIRKRVPPPLFRRTPKHKNIILQKIEHTQETSKKDLNNVSDPNGNLLVLDYTKVDNLKKQIVPNPTQDQLKRLNINIFHGISPREKYVLEDLDFGETQKILKIFAFSKNFIDKDISSNLTITKLVKYLKEPTYNAEAIGDFHDDLVDNLINEIDTYGMSQLLINIKSVIDSLPEDDTFGEIKKRNDIGLKTWKIKARTLLWDLQSKTNNKTIYSFYAILSKKKALDIEEAFRVRTDLLEFLISCYFTTNIFRDILLNELKNLENLEKRCSDLEKTIKALEAELINTAEEEMRHKRHVLLTKMKEELHEVKIGIIYNPTKSDIGMINQTRFFFIDNVIYASKGRKFYMPSQKTLEAIAAFYIPTDKIEGSALNCLKNVIEIIYQ